MIFLFPFSPPPTFPPERAYRRAVDTRHEDATVGLRSEAELRGAERAWLHTFAQFCHAKDHTNLTALEVALHHAEELQLGEQCEAVRVYKSMKNNIFPCTGLSLF